MAQAATCLLSTAQPSSHWIVRREAGSERRDLPIFSAPASATPASGGSRAAATKEVVDEALGIFVLHDVLTADECEAIVATSEAMGYTEDAPVSLGRDVRKNENCVWIMDPECNDRIFDRARDLLPEAIDFRGMRLAPCVGLNRRWRLYKYSPTDVFKVHNDGAWTGSGLDASGDLVADIYGGTAFSWLTFLIYLTDDFAGGGTSFYSPRGRQLFTVRPKRGSVLCFFHGHHRLSPLHQGDLVTEGVKYVARTDVLYNHAPS